MFHTLNNHIQTRTPTFYLPFVHLPSICQHQGPSHCMRNFHHGEFLQLLHSSPEYRKMVLVIVLTSIHRAGRSRVNRELSRGFSTPLSHSSHWPGEKIFTSGENEWKNLNTNRDGKFLLTLEISRRFYRYQFDKFSASGDGDYQLQNLDFFPIGGSYDVFQGRRNDGKSGKAEGWNELKFARK